MIIINFTQEEMEFFAATGTKRTEENKNKPNIADYNNNYMKGLTGLQADKLGVAAEAGVVKMLGYDPLTVSKDIWPSFYTNEEAAQYKNSPDVMHDNKVFEVRRVNKKTSPLCIRTKDVENKAVVIKVYIPYKHNEDGTIKVKPEAHIEVWADAENDWYEAVRPGWAKTNNSRVTAGRPIEELLGGEL